MKITVTPQRPYVVEDAPAGPHRARPLVTERDEPLSWQHDAALGDDDSYALCRCGGSSSKPYCDGTHNTIKWDGT